jgi:hypothetical protein
MSSAVEMRCLFQTWAYVQILLYFGPAQDLLAAQVHPRFEAQFGIPAVIFGRRGVGRQQCFAPNAQYIHWKTPVALESSPRH